MRSWAFGCCSSGPSTRKVSSTRSPSVLTLASCRLMVVPRQHAAMAYSRPERSLAVTVSSQRWALVGRPVTRGTTGKLLTRRDPAAAGLGQWAVTGQRQPPGPPPCWHQLAVLSASSSASRDDLEGVQPKPARVVVDLGVLDAEAALVEVAADARRTGRAGRAVHQHLQAFAHRRSARTTGTSVWMWSPRRACVPGDVAGVVAHEVAHVQRLPQRLFGAGQRRSSASF